MKTSSTYLTEIDIPRIMKNIENSKSAEFD